MLIEDVEVVSLKVFKELFRLNGQEKSPMSVLGQFLSVFASDFQMLLSVGRDPKERMR